MAIWIGFVVLVLISILIAYRSPNRDRTLKFLVVAIAIVILLFLALRLGGQLAAIITSFFVVIVPAISKMMEFANKVKTKNSFQDKMTVAEAEKILGVKLTDGPAKIKAAYKKLIEKNHPDKDGSEYLAQKINQAKDLLLRKSERK